MGNLSQFMKANKKQKQNVLYPATKSLCDADGNPLMWELKPISTKENEKIREFYTSEVPVKGKPGQFRIKIDTNSYMKKLICAAVVHPNLYDKELQNSYGVASAEDLLEEMIDDAGEYADLQIKVQEISGFSTLQEDVDAVKNL